MAPGAGDGKPRRPYRSQARADRARATRRKILAAAHELFVAQGYTATGMRAVASVAGVSVPLVEQAFGTKRNLLKNVVDTTTAGDDEPVAMLARAPAQAARAATTSVEFLALAVAEIGTVAARVGAVHAVVAAAAAQDAEIADLAGDLDAQRRAVAAWLVENLDLRGGLRPELDRARAVDTAWVLLDPVVHQRLTRDRGWSTDEFTGWLNDALTRLLLPGT